MLQFRALGTKKMAISYVNKYNLNDKKKVHSRSRSKGPLTINVVMGGDHGA